MKKEEKVEKNPEVINISELEQKFIDNAAKYIMGLTHFGEWDKVESDKTQGLMQGLRRSNHSFSYTIAASYLTNTARVVLKYSPEIDKCSKGCCQEGRPNYSITFLSSGIVDRTPSVPGEDIPHVIVFLDEVYRFLSAVYTSKPESSSIQP